MNYTINVTKVRGANNTNTKAYATITIGGVFKIKNIAIIENKE